MNFLGKNILEIKLSKILTYLICILLCLRLTQLYNCELFYKLLPISVCLSFILILLNYKKFNKHWIANNYLIIIYCIIRIISIVVNNGMIINLKTFIYEIFFLIIVTQLLDKENIYNTSKILVFINFILNIISIAYQYFFEMRFDIELYGVYTNPNALASYTCLSIVLYKELIEKRENKILNWSYILFSITIILLSNSRTPFICLTMYILMKLILNRGIDIKKIKSIFNILLIGSLMCIIATSYLNKNNIYPTKFEVSINDITTNRYYLWKYSIFSLEKNPMLGIGENNIGKYRRDCVNEEIIQSLNSVSRENRLLENNNHNGYIQSLVGNGYVCFIIFMIIILKNLNRMDEKFFLISFVILVINLFENELILTQSIYIFILMYMFNDKNESKNL